MTAPSRAISLALAGALLISAAGTAAAADDLPSAGADFGHYEVLPLLDDTAPYAGPATPKSLAEVRISPHVNEQLPPGARERLAEQGFVIVPEKLRLFHDAYDEQYYAGTPVFVTTDAAYNAWHLSSTRPCATSRPEADSCPRSSARPGMRKNASTAQGTRRHGPADDAARIVDLIARRLRSWARTSSSAPGPKPRRTSSTPARPSASSPILGTETDYSLFAPRGHYTRTKALTRYFVAMSVLGQHAFRLPGSVQTDATS